MEKRSNCRPDFYNRYMEAAGVGAGSSDQRSPGWNSHESASNRKKELEDEKRNTKRRIVQNGGDDEEEGIAAVREKLTLDLKNIADRLKDVIFKNTEKEKEEEQPPNAAEKEAELPWNLRKRRTERKCGGGGSGKGLKSEEEKGNGSSPARNNGVKLLNLRSNSNNKTESVRFRLELTKEEIEEDFIKMTGQPPPRRPNKRPKHVQKYLDNLCPGLGLSQVSADLYKVDEAATGNGNVRRQSAKGKAKE